MKMTTAERNSDKAAKREQSNQRSKNFLIVRIRNNIERMKKTTSSVEHTNEHAAAVVDDDEELENTKISQLCYFLFPSLCMNFFRQMALKHFQNISPFLDPHVANTTRTGKKKVQKKLRGWKKVNFQGVDRSVMIF